MSSKEILDNLFSVAAPIIAKDTVSKWRIISDIDGPYDNVTIEGRWSEDGNYYGIVAPLPIAKVLIALQCELTAELAKVKEEKEDLADELERPRDQEERK